MKEELPFWVFLPLFVISTAAFLYLRRHEFAAWLGFKGKK